MDMEEVDHAVNVVNVPSDDGSVPPQPKQKRTAKQGNSVKGPQPRAQPRGKKPVGRGKQNCKLRIILS